MLPALIVVYMTPLDIQRPTALLMLLGALAWGEYVALDATPLSFGIFLIDTSCFQCS